MKESSEQDVRLGHDLRVVQDDNGVDLGLLQRNLKLSVEERLRTLEDFIAFAGAVRRAEPER